jgi:hypothetical protein
LLGVNDDAIEFGRALIEGHAIPAKAAIDALHVAICCVYGINYLLTWNCKHIANAERFKDIERVCKHYHYSSPIICTPEELLGEGI